MLVDEFAALLVVEQYSEQLVALLRGQAFDPYRHQAVDVKRLASSRGMRAHHRMRIGGHARRGPCAALHGRRFIVVGIERLAAVDVPLDLGRQGFIRRVTVGEQCVAARARHLERVQHRGHRRALLVALIGMKMHLAVGQGADRLPVLADVGDQHHRGVVAHELLGMDHRRRPELFRETNLVLLAQILTAQHNDEVLVPSVANLREHPRVDVIAQINTENLGPECRGQRPYAQRGRRRLDLAGSGFHPFAPSPVVCAVVG